MKINQIRNGLIKNKPNYNFDICDDDHVVVAKGHLINSKQKQIILNSMHYDIDQNGQIKYKIQSVLQFYGQWLVKALDWWLWQDLPITMQSVYGLDFDVVKWLSEQIQAKITQSLQLVEQNAKN